MTEAISAPAITLEVYLATNFRPDRDYVDGFVYERNIGEFDHADLQAELLVWLRSMARDWGIRAVPEQRVQVSLTKFRVPDLCVLRRERAVEQIVSSPPLICIEILFKQDSLRQMQERVDDYLLMGVENVWILDPVSKRGYVCTQGGMNRPAKDELAVAGTEIKISLGELFSRVEKA